MDGSILEVQNLTKYYGKIKGIDWRGQSGLFESGAFSGNYSGM